MSKELKDFLKFSFLMMIVMMSAATISITLILDIIIGNYLSLFFFGKIVINSILIYFIIKNNKEFKELKKIHLDELISLSENKK